MGQAGEMRGGGPLAHARGYGRNGGKRSGSGPLAYARGYGGGKLFFEADQLIAVDAEWGGLPVFYSGMDRVGAGTEDERCDRGLGEE